MSFVDNSSISAGGTGNGSASFSDSSSILLGGSLNGDANFFGNASNCGSIIGNAEFDNSSCNGNGSSDGWVYGNALFRGSSSNRGAGISGTVTFMRSAATAQITGNGSTSWSGAFASGVIVENDETGGGDILGAGLL